MGEPVNGRPAGDKRGEYLDRGEAVNLAINITDDAPTWMRVLADAVIAMNKELTKLYAARDALPSHEATPEVDGGGFEKGEGPYKFTPATASTERTTGDDPSPFSLVLRLREEADNSPLRDLLREAARMIERRVVAAASTARPTLDDDCDWPVCGCNPQTGCPGMQGLLQEPAPINAASPEGNPGSIVRNGPGQPAQKADAPASGTRKETTELPSADAAPSSTRGLSDIRTPSGWYTAATLLPSLDRKHAQFIKDAPPGDRDPQAHASVYSEAAAMIRMLIAGESATREPTDPDARRFRAMLKDPLGARHLLNLLHQGKGDEANFRSMIDRIASSRADGTVADK